MNSLQNLTHAATLKGFLLATRAPKHIVDLAQAIVDTETVRAGEQQPKIAGHVSIPSADELARAIAAVSKNAPSHDESRSSAPETPQGEENDASAAGEDAGEANDASVSTAGETHIEPLATAGTFSRTFDHFPVTQAGERSAPAAGTAQKKSPHACRGNGKLAKECLPEIQEMLADMSFDDVGAKYGVAGNSVRGFLRRNGIDDRQYNKPGGRRPRAEASPDVKASPVKPERTMALVDGVKPPGESSVLGQAPSSSTNRPKASVRSVA